MTLIFSAGAEVDTVSAMEWYNSQRIGLGVEFLEMLQHLLESIEAAPESFARDESFCSRRDLRQGLLRRFPYKVVFEIKSTEEILVLVVAHTSRYPEFWAGREL